MYTFNVPFLVFGFNLDGSLENGQYHMGHMTKKSEVKIYIFTTVITLLLHLLFDIEWSLILKSLICSTNSSKTYVN